MSDQRIEEIAELDRAKEENDDLRKLLDDTAMDRAGIAGKLSAAEKLLEQAEAELDRAKEETKRIIRDDGLVVTRVRKRAERAEAQRDALTTALRAVSHWAPNAPVRDSGIREYASESLARIEAAE